MLPYMFTKVEITENCLFCSRRYYFRRTVLFTLMDGELGFTLREKSALIHVRFAL